jgi:hypothetical protein
MRNSPPGIQDMFRAGAGPGTARSFSRFSSLILREPRAGAVEPFVLRRMGESGGRLSQAKIRRRSSVLVPRSTLFRAESDTSRIRSLQDRIVCALSSVHRGRSGPP